jgi:dipeptidyl aminopeptidase/acylaminoacyl peptidase
MKKGILLFIFINLLIMNNYAQEELKFQLPPREILDLVDIKPQPAVVMDADNRYLVMLDRNAMKSLHDLAEEEVRLAGVRINPRLFMPSRKTYYLGISIRDLLENRDVQLRNLPSALRISDVRFSPDGHFLAFINTIENRPSLWIIDMKTGEAREIFNQPMNGVLGAPFLWLPDESGLLVVVVPEGSWNNPPEKPLPVGPSVQEASGKKAPVRTYQDLLRNPYDEQLFEYYATANILKIKLDGTLIPFMPPAMYAGLSWSPDGNYLLVSTIEKPFSYKVPFYRFSMKYTLHSKTGEFLRDIYSRGIVEDVPPSFDACEKGRRELGWRLDAPAQLFWVEALDGGDPSVETSERDALYLMDVSNIESQPVKVATTSLRFSDIIWGNGKLAVLKENWYKTRESLTYFIAPDEPSAGKRLVFDVSTEDLYNDPGEFITRRGPFKTQILWFSDDKKFLYLEGEGFSPQGNKPFLDQMNLQTLKTHRLWQADGKSTYESILRIIDPQKVKLITSVESKFQNPNLYFREKNQLKTITNFPNPYTDFSQKVVSEKVFYKRSDGIDLDGTLYLPVGYDFEKDGPLPLLMWAYPREYKDAAHAGQVKDSPHQFVRLHYGSPVFWVLRGFAVLDEAAFPIVAKDGGEPNDTFVEQLVENASAAIDYLAERGIVDRRRVAIGGHSYGAFMVANLLAHSDLFAAGIARSGAYNRTLTPFGFQSEERTFWEAPDIYMKMSPFVYAHKIKAPLLLIHGDADNNPGTFTLQSERMFAAINGLGGTARLVLLPFESHGYAARENILHMLWETDRWLEKYVKTASK